MKQPVIREHHRRLKEVFKTDDLQMMARVIRLASLAENWNTTHSMFNIAQAIFRGEGGTTNQE